MDKSTIIRLGVLIVTLTNLMLTEFGINPLSVSDEIIYEVISILVTCVAAFWNAWKNNNLTTAAKVSQKVLDAVKSGKITVKKVEKFLTD